MDHKRKIGTEIKTKLKTLTATPDDKVWNNIQNELRKKNRKRIVIIWFWVLGLGILGSFTWYQLNIEEQDLNNSIKSDLDENSNEVKKCATAIPIITDVINDSIDDQNQLKIRKTNNTAQNFTKKSNKTYNTSKKSISKNNFEKKESKSDNKTDTVESTTDKTKTHTNTSDLRFKPEIPKTAKTTPLDESKIDSLRIKKKVDKKSSELDSSSIANHSKWSVTPQVAMSYFGAFGAKTTKNISLNYSILLSYRMSTKLYLRTGIRILDLQQTIEKNNQELSYLEFPIEVKYLPFQSTKIRPFTTVGFSYFNKQSNITAVNTLDYDVNMSFNLGIGVETKLAKKIYLNVESNWNYFLTSLVQSNNINPYVISIYTGIEYRF